MTGESPNLAARDLWRVVVADDSPDDRAEVRRMLLQGSERRYRFTEAETGAAAVLAVREDPDGPPDCLVIDHYLPDMDALEVIGALTGPDHLPVCPVVVITGEVGSDTGRAVLQAGAQDYIGKDWLTSPGMTRAVENAAERYALARQLHSQAAALRDSEASLRAVVTGAVDAIISIDAAGTILSFNPAAERIFGYDAGEVLGRNVSMLMPSPHREGHDGYLASYLRTGERHVIGVGREIPARRKDGTVFPMEIGVSEIQVGGNVVFVGMLRDITERRAAEQAIRTGERRLRTIFDCLTDTLLITDQDGRVSEANPGACASLGYPRERLLGMSVSEFDVTGDPEKARELVWSKLARPEEACTFRAIHRRSDGTTFPVEVRGRWVDWEGRPQFLAISRDLTHRERAEARLRESLSFQETLLEAIPAPVFYKDREGRFLGGNSSLFRFVGWRREDVIGRTITGLVAGELGELHREMDRRLFESPGTQVYQARVLDAEGLPRDVVFHKATIPDDDGSPRGIVGVIQDITERLRAEEVVRSLNEELERRVVERTADVRKLASIIDASTDFVGLATPDGRPTWQNAAFRRFAGLSDRDAPGLDSIRHIHPPEAARKVFEEAIPAALREGHWLGENEVISADGRLVPVSQLVLAHRDDGGDVAFISTIMRDISERRRLEATLHERSEALSLANAELARASRLKDEFLASMSHELRTPLTGILAISEGLREGVYGELGPEQARCLGDVEECGRHLLALINDILDVAKIGAGMVELEVAELAPGPLCEAAARFVKQAALRKKISIGLSSDGTVETVAADERRLKQVLVNLLSNAVKFTDAGGRVGLEVEGDPVRREARFAVWDTGIGISREGLARLFSPFVQLDSGLDRKYAGTGLGLVLAKTLTELHGGKLEVESEPGRGSRFTVILPWDPGEPPASDRGGDGKPGVLTGSGGSSSKADAVRPRILVVDDDVWGVRALRDYLATKGCDVELAESGEAGIARALAETPDLVLMDIQMPGLDGLETIRRIRRIPGLAGVPIIALTALAMSDDRERSIEAGATDYVSKPASLSELYGRIRGLLMREPG